MITKPTEVALGLRCRFTFHFISHPPSDFPRGVAGIGLTWAQKN